MKKLNLAFVCALLLASSAWAKTPLLSITAQPAAFSPNADGNLDVLTLQVKAKKIKKPLGWEIQIKDAAGTTYRVFSGHNPPPFNLGWDGKDDVGKSCPEGVYQAILKVADKKDHIYVAQPLEMWLDVSTPAASVRTLLSYCRAEKGLLLNPVTFYCYASDLSGIADWKLTVANNLEKNFTVASGKGAPPATSVLEKKMFPVSAGTLTAILTVSDNAGNRMDSAPLQLDIRTPDRLQDSPPKAIPAPEAAAPPKAASQPNVTSPSAAPASYLQMTSILSIADLFGNDAGRDSQLLPGSATILLDPLAQALKDSPGSRAFILGHADARADAKALSSAFAWKVFSYFVKQKGIDKSSVSVKGLGADVPVSDNRTGQGRERNRRIEIQMFLASPQEKLP